MKYGTPSANIKRRARTLVGALLLGAAVVVSGAIGAMMYAPYLPRLMTERYPQPQWPSPGSFATVKGESTTPLDIDASTGDFVLDARGRTHA